MPPGKLVARPLFNFTLVRGYYDAGGAYAPIAGDQLVSTYSLSLYAEYGLGTARPRTFARTASPTRW